MTKGIIRPAVYCMCLWFVVAITTVSAQALKGSYISGMLINATGFAVANGNVKLIDPDGVMLNVTSTDRQGKFKLDLDTLEDEDLENLNQSFLHFSDAKGKSTRIQIGSRAVQEKGYISFPAVSLE